MTRIFNSFFIGLILWLSLMASAQEVIEAIVAIVNDDYISLSEYKERHDLYYQILRSQLQGEEFDRQYKEIKKNLMDMMITDLLLLQEAQNMGLDVSAQVQEQIERFKEQNGFDSDDELIHALNQQGISFEDWRQDMEDNVLRQSVLFSEVGRSIVVDDSELVGYYNQNREQFRQPEEYTLKAIYVSSESRTKEEIEGIKKEIDAKIDAGEDMSVLASEYGEGPEKDVQGNLGSFKKGDLAPNLEQAVIGLEVGEISSWIQMPGGWYLLRLEERKESRIPAFEEIRETIEQTLYEEKNDVEVNKYLKELKKRSFIKILIPDPLEIR
jgi:peptidyl-prolyl cis-trans isomerase SurA